MFRNLLLTSVAVVTISTLSACGGGEDDAPTAPTGTEATASANAGTTGTVANQPTIAGTATQPGPDEYWLPRPPNAWTDLILPRLFHVGLTPACHNCGAIDAHTYSPEKGVGIWQRANNYGVPVDVPVIINGLTGQDVTLTFTNVAKGPKDMPPITLASEQTSRPSANVLRSQMVSGHEGHGGHGVRDAELRREMDEFSRTGWLELAAKLKAAPQSAPLYSERRTSVNDRKTWYAIRDRSFQAQLVRQFSTSDGTTVNIWVEDGEYVPGKITDEIIGKLGGWFVDPGKIYDLVKSAGGPLWGPHYLSGLMVQEGQPFDIVIENIQPRGYASGYFTPRDLFRHSRLLSPTANGALAVHLDSEELYAGGEKGLKDMAATLAHEATHLQNFYRRTLKMGFLNMNDVWLEEMSAMMMMDYATHVVDPDISIVRDYLFGSYIYGEGMYNCGLTQWTMDHPSCHPYAVAGSFGAFLNRQLGIGFYRNLLNATRETTSLHMMDKTIRAATGNAGFDEMFRRFTATTGGMIKAGAEPAGYGFPARVEGGFTLAKIDPQAFAPTRTLVSKVPAQLQPLASLPIVRPKVDGYFWETVKVPPGTVLTVVVQ